jgi:hypothetical protein
MAGGATPTAAGSSSDTGCCRLVAGGHGGTASRPARTAGVVRAPDPLDVTPGTTPGLALELLDVVVLLP